MANKINIKQIILPSSQKGDLPEENVSLLENQLNDFLKEKGLSLEDVRITHTSERENVDHCGIIHGSQIYTVFYPSEKEKKPFRKILGELLYYKIF